MIHIISLVAIGLLAWCWLACVTLVGWWWFLSQQDRDEDDNY